MSTRKTICDEENVPDRAVPLDISLSLLIPIPVYMDASFKVRSGFISNGTATMFCSWAEKECLKENHS